MRLTLQKAGHRSAVIHTILALWCKSTNRIYEITWKDFTRWCKSQGCWWPSATVSDDFSFLQASLHRGLSTSILRRQVSALATVVHPSRQHSLSLHSHGRCFLRGGWGVLLSLILLLVTIIHLGASIKWFQLLQSLSLSLSQILCSSSFHTRLPF